MATNDTHPDPYPKCRIAYTLEESCRFLARVGVDDLRADADAHFARMAELANLDWANKHRNTVLQPPTGD